MEANGEPPSRGPGRPRKWASEAERKRAYRKRLAADLAEPDRLRQELRSVRERIVELERSLSGLRHDHEQAARALERCAEQRDRRIEEVVRLKAEVRRLRDVLREGWR